MRAMPQVSTEPLMVVLSGQRSGNLSVASDAYTLLWSRSRLAYAESVMESISGVIKTMRRWDVYWGSLLSIDVGKMNSKKSVCMACVVGRLAFDLKGWCSGLVVVTYSLDVCPDEL